MKSRELLLILSLVTLVTVIFGRTASFDFINYDDPEYVTGNEIIRQGITPGGLKWAATEAGRLNLWQPLTYLSHMLDVELFGTEKASGHHLVNALWHAAASLGLFLLLRSLTGNLWLSLLLAAFWAVHPQRVQSVAWISERKDVLSGTFLFWTWWAWERWRANERTSWYALALTFFILGGLSKASVVPLPAILFIREMLRGNETPILERARHWALRLAPFFLIAGAIALLAIHFQSKGEMASVTDVMPLSRRLGLMPVSLWWYLRSLIYPFPGQLWVYPPEDTLMAWVWSALGLITFASLCWWLRKNRLLWLGLATFLLMWLPVSGLVPVSFYYVADRYAYFIQPGLLLIIAAIAQSLSRRTYTFVLAIMITFGVIITEFRLSSWKNSETLFTREMQINPRSLLAPIQLADVMESRGDWQTASSLYQKALVIDPESGLAATNLGRLLLKMKRPEEAKQALLRATNCQILHHSMSFSLLAQIALEENNHNEALQILHRGRERFPRDPKLMTDIGSLLLRSNTPPLEILEWFEKSLISAPDHLDALQGKGVVLLKLGRKKEGLEALQEVIRKDPTRISIRKLLEATR